MNEFKLNCETSGVRLDKFISDANIDLSRSAAVNLIENGAVLVNDSVVSKKYKLSYQSISRTPLSVESYHGKGAPARGIGGKCALEPPLTGGFAELYEEALFGTSRHQAGNSIVRSPIGTTSPTFGVRSFQSAR